MQHFNKTRNPQTGTQGAKERRFAMNFKSMMALIGAMCLFAFFAISINSSTAFAAAPGDCDYCDQFSDPARMAGCVCKAVSVSTGTTTSTSTGTTGGKKWRGGKAKAKVECDEETQVLSEDEKSCECKEEFQACGDSCIALCEEGEVLNEETCECTLPCACFVAFEESMQEYMANRDKTRDAAAKAAADQRHKEDMEKADAIINALQAADAQAAAAAGQNDFWLKVIAALLGIFILVTLLVYRSLKKRLEQAPTANQIGKAVADALPEPKPEPLGPGSSLDDPPAGVNG